MLQNDATIPTDLTLLNFEIKYRNSTSSEILKLFHDGNYEPTSDDPIEIYGLVYVKTDSALTLTIVECAVSNTLGFKTGSFLTSFAPSQSVDIQGGSFTENYGLYGGVFYFSNLISLTITSSTFTSNIAYYGGGIFLALENNEKTLFDDDVVDNDMGSSAAI